MSRSGRYGFLWLIACFLAAFSGCASTGSMPGHPAAGGGSQGPDLGWWYATFRINWPENQDPAWHIDLLLAHQVISPVLDSYEDRLVLWRFHRRAARDQSGHVFSFIFYTTADTASEICNRIKSQGRLGDLKNAGLIIVDSYTDTSRITKPCVEDTCDAKWSSPIKKCWPYYIMGVSRMWLGLITEIAGSTSAGKTPLTLQECEDLYKSINNSVIKTWQEEGRHAFLHHLNAIFGYEPLVVYEKRIMGF